MKKIFQTVLLGLSLLLSANLGKSQCVSSQLNWDTKDYYWNSGGGAPYENYISNTMEQNQKFAIGRNWLSIVTSSPDLVSPGWGNSAENTTHTGDITGYTGADVQYNPTTNGQTITITFNQPAGNVSFTLYDIDRSARIDVDAYDAGSIARNVNVVTYASSILAITNNNNVNTYVTASNTDLANNSNRGTATFTINNVIKTIVITVTTVGSDAVFWLSDINACINNGNFPTNWHQAAPYSRPFVGPTQNMPDYFLVTPDNSSAYYVNPANGQARELFSDASMDYINSFGYDPYNRYLYYSSEDASLNPSNKTIKRYDYNSETSNITFISNVTTVLGIPTFNYGVESAGCAFYDSALYLGIEGGNYDPSFPSNVRTRETIIWRIDLDASNNATVAYQVAAFDHYINATRTSVHDWGDFIIKNGVIYDFNTARNSCGTGCNDYTNSSYHHYNLVTGQLVTYANPNNTPPSNRNTWNGQSGMTWAGGLYYFRPKPSSSTTSQIGLYNEDGTNGTAVDISVVSGTAWPNASSGDASDPFRPKCDFGDAPASYDPYSDPSTQSPAVHERSENIRLGASWNYEFWKRGVSGTDDTDDGLSMFSFMPPGIGEYLAQASVYNNSGANATLIAWLDFNGNGVFDASEAITPITVPSSGSQQYFYLYWPSTPNTFNNGDFTYMRVRITAASAGMTASHPTGYFTNGEVEDFRVTIDNFPLSINVVSFDAKAKDNKKVELNWTASEDGAPLIYELQRSKNSSDWQHLDYVNGKSTQGQQSYNYTDDNPFSGISYYRVKFADGKYSNIRSVKIADFESEITISPNPAQNFITLKIEGQKESTININLLNTGGNSILQKKFAMVIGVNKFIIPLEKLPSGTYLLVISDAEGNKASKKILIKK